MDESSFERRDRVLLRPWLENMLENGSIPGLEWFDKDRMMFKVPWKHRSKKDWSLRHSSVFLVRDCLLSVSLCTLVLSTSGNLINFYCILV